MKPLSVEDGTATCRTCMLPIHRAAGYETCAIDLAIWKHPNGKESCDGFGLWARAMPDLNPRPNTKGVEDGMSDEQACDCGHRRGKHYHGRGMCEARAINGHICYCSRFKLPKPAAIRSATPEELTAQPAVPVEERTRVLMEALKAVENERLDMHEKYLNPDGEGFADTDFSYSHAINDAENAIKALITAPIPEERTAEMEQSGAVIRNMGDGLLFVDWGNVHFSTTLEGMAGLAHDLEFYVGRETKGQNR